MEQGEASLPPTARGASSCLVPWRAPGLLVPFGDHIQPQSGAEPSLCFPANGPDWERSQGKGLSLLTGLVPLAHVDCVLSVLFLGGFPSCFMEFGFPYPILSRRA